MAKKDVSITVLLQDQASGGFRKIEASATSLQSKLGSLKGDLAGIAAGAGLTGLAGYAVKAAKDWGLAVDDIIDQTGAAGEEASKLLAIGERTGLGLDEMAGMFAKFGKGISTARDEMAKAAATGEESNDIFTRLHLAPEDLKSGNIYEIYTKVAGKMRELGDAADFDRAAMDMFGRSGRQMHDMLTMTDEEMQKVIARAEAMGLIISSDTAAAWEQFDRNLQDVTRSVNRLAVTIGNELLPIAEDTLSWLQKVADGLTIMDDDQKKSAASAVTFAAEVGVATVAVKSLQTVMATFHLSMVNPWIAVAGAIALATVELAGYRKKLGELSDDERWDVIFANSAEGADAWEKIKAGRSYGSMSDYKRANDTNAKKYSLALAPDKKPGALRDVNTGDKSSEIQTLQNKVDNMLRTLSEKVIQETGTTAQYQLLKVADEVEKMQGELAANAKKLAMYGIDTSALQDKMKEYNDVATKQIFDTQSRAQRSFAAETKLINAQVLDDKKAEADAEYEAALVSLEGQLVEKRKITQDQKQLDEWYNAEYGKLLKERNIKYRDAELEAYNYHIQYNDMLFTLEGRSHAEIDQLNKIALQNGIKYIDDQLKHETEGTARWMQLQREKAEALNRLYNIAGRDPSTAYGEAMRRMKDIQTDYADIMVQSWSDIDNAVQDHFKNMFTGAENMAEGIEGIIRDMATNVQVMMAQMLYQQVVMQPLKDWWGSVLGGILGTAKPAPSGMGDLKAADRYASGGDFGPGWRLTGEFGPELERVDYSGHIYTAAETRAILNPRQRQSEQRPINFYITTPDANSFRRSQSQIYAEAHAALAKGGKNL